MASAQISSTVIASYVIALATGILQALGTPWGLARHYWVLFKLLIIITATFMLLMKTGPISYMASVAAEGMLGPTDLRGLRLSILGHSVGGLAVLLWAMALGTYKPNATTAFGRNASERPR